MCCVCERTVLVCVNVCIYVCVYINVCEWCIYVRVYMCVCACARACTGAESLVKLF